MLRRKLEPLACWPHQYAKLPRRAWDDPRLHQGAKLTLAVILCAARGRRQFATYKRSLAADARVCERTMYEHLKLLEATGYIITWRASRRSPLLVRVADPALVRHRPLPGWAEAGWALQRSRHPKAADALAAADRRLRRTHLALGLGPVGIAIPTSMILTDSEPPTAGGSGPDSASRRSAIGGLKLPPDPVVEVDPDDEVLVLVRFPRDRGARAAVAQGARESGARQELDRQGGKR